MNQAPWTADVGDGTYRNPVLNADWSDPDVIRVGDDFHLTASSFGRVPGLPLLHSRDLVNWTLVGHAVERLEPAEAFDEPRHDCGVWAPALRHHDGRFWIFWGDPDHGIFQVNAADFGGPWSRPLLIKPGKGLIDACPLWDEVSGEAYLVHGWAKSRSGIKNRLTGHRMRPDGTGLLDEGRVIVDGDRIPGWFTLEGPKLYRHDGWFWIFAPAGGVETGWQGAFRSRDFFGPYEERIVLEQGDTDVNGPHQGGWVRTRSGQDWFLHFQARGAYGRVVHLQPMRFDAEGWPVIGDGGAPVAVHRKPELPQQPVSAPATDDDFPGGTHGPQWQWTANPRADWLQRHPEDGLRLAYVPSAHAHDLRKLPNVLTQRLPGSPAVVECELSLDGGLPGCRAGLAVLGDAFSWIGLERAGDGRVLLVHRFAEAVAEGERDAAVPQLLTRATARVLDVPAPPGGPGTREEGEDRVRLRIEIGTGARCRFSWAPPAARTSTGPAAWRPSGPVFTATAWRWVGALLGLFALAPTEGGPGGTPVDGAATFHTLRVTAPAVDDALLTTAIPAEKSRP